MLFDALRYYLYSLFYLEMRNGVGILNTIRKAFTRINVRLNRIDFYFKKIYNN